MNKEEQQKRIDLAEKKAEQLLQAMTLNRQELSNQSGPPSPTEQAALDTDQATYDKQIAQIRTWKEDLKRANDTEKLRPLHATQPLQQNNLPDA